MDKNKLGAYKFWGGAFLLFVAASWIWSWIFPTDPNAGDIFKNPAPIIQTPIPQLPPTTNYYEPCEDEFTAEDYRDCMEGIALDDWYQEQQWEAGLP
jgi:hypothetical protein